MTSTRAYECPFCTSTKNQRLLFGAFDAFDNDDCGHVYCRACGVSYDDDVDVVKNRVLTQENLEAVDDRETYRSMFVETWEISGDDGEVYSDFQWEDNQELQHGVAQHALTAIDVYFNARRPPDILDLGCGDGFTTKIFSETYGADHVIGLDPSPLILETAKKANIRGLRGTLETVKFEDAQFDVVVILGNLMLHHDVTFTLREVHRILRPGGIVIFDFKNVNSTPRRVARWIAMIFPSIGRHSLIQRNYVNMRYGMARSHISKIAPSLLFEQLEVVGKPPRLLEFKNKDTLSTGLKGAVWRVLGWVDRQLGEQAWLQVTARKK